MKTVSRVWFLLAAFLVTASAVYWLTAHERAGAGLLLVGAAAFTYMALVGRSIAEGETRQEAAEPSEEVAEIHVSPTIWPFGFSIAALFLVLAAIVTPWLLVVGIPLFVLAAAGWFRDVARGRSHAGDS